MNVPGLCLIINTNHGVFAGVEFVGCRIYKHRSVDDGGDLLTIPWPRMRYVADGMAGPSTWCVWQGGRLGGQVIFSCDVIYRTSRRLNLSFRGITEPASKDARIATGHP